MKYKNKIIAFFILLMNTTIYSQTAGFNYQALILDNSNTENKIPLASEDVTFRFTITDTEKIEYTEEQSITTDENGMVSLIIGEGTPITSTFDKINWNGELKFLNVEIDVLKHNEGFTFLDSQKILYIPHPSPHGNNVKIVSNENNITAPFKIGDLIWVKDFGLKKKPTLIIWDGKNWSPVSSDYDPTNELGLLVVTNNSTRDLQFTNPLVGDQVWNQSCSCIEVYEGSQWVSINTATSNISNGLYKDKDGVKLGGTLIEPTALITSTTNTLAIKNLQESKLIDDEFVKIERGTGILRRGSVSSFIKQEEAIIYASDGQLQFSTPIPITDPKKIDVYRNGIRIDFTAINTTTIKLEQDAICYKNDKIRIVQLQ